jgi:5,10-methylenetetrahydrofolate reductase
MIEEAHAYQARTFVAGATIRVGTTVPSWKAKADFLLAQVSYDFDRLVAWRDGLRYDGKLFAGVMVMASSKMAHRIAADVPEIGVPADLIEELDADRDAGVERAVELVERIRESHYFDGVHLVPVGRYADVAALLRRSRHP